MAAATDRMHGLRALCFALAVCSAYGCESASDDFADGVLRPQTGPFDGTLAIEPDPPQVGEHRVLITLDALDGEPLAGASVGLSPWMPAHGHGSIDVEAVEQGAGLYVAQGVLFNMPGIWDLRVRVEAGDEHGDLLATIEVP